TGLVSFLLGAPPSADTPAAAPGTGVDTPAAAPAPQDQATTAPTTTAAAPTTTGGPEPAPAGSPTPEQTSTPAPTTTTAAPAAPAQRPGVNNSRTAPGSNAPQTQ